MENGALIRDADRCETSHGGADGVRSRPHDYKRPQVATRADFRQSARVQMSTHTHSWIFTAVGLALLGAGGEGCSGDPAAASDPPCVEVRTTCDPLYSPPNYA